MFLSVADVGSIQFTKGEGGKKLSSHDEHFELTCHNEQNVQIILFLTLNFQV